MGKALDTIFYPYEQGLLQAPKVPFSLAFLNAQYHPMLSSLGAEHLFLQQYFKLYAADLQDHGLSVSSDITEEEDVHDVVLIALPKNMIEAQYLMAQGLRILKKSGVLICSADNKAGGSRIKEIMQKFSLDDLQEESKNKARVVWGHKEKVDNDIVYQAIEEGSMQKILDGGFVSMPGIFGWDKIDKGSEILLQQLPEDLKGAGADFGCGYGYLSKHILQNCEGIESLVCIDADYRAIKACQDNLKISEAQTRFFWEDLTQPLPSLTDLDFIVMNPPFHEGKETAADIGKTFIKIAAESLRSSGELWVVANAHLPYEAELDSQFSSCVKKFEGEGFKVFCAKK